MTKCAFYRVKFWENFTETLLVEENTVRVIGFICFVFFTAFFNISSPLQAKSIIFDTDMLFDDWQSILYLSHSKETKLEGVVITVYDRKKCILFAKMARYLLTLDKGKDETPILCLAEAPISGYHNFPPLFHEITFKAFNNILKNDPSIQDLESYPLNDFYTDFGEWAKRISGSKLYYLMTGPATNLAVIREKHHDFFQRIEETIAMGGAINVPGNLITTVTPQFTNKQAEWNVWVDIAAYDIVLSSWWPRFNLIPLDATNPLVLEYADKELFSTNTASERFMRQMYDELKWGFEDKLFYYWDQLATVAVNDIDETGARNENVCSLWELGNLAINRSEILYQPEPDHVFDQKRPLEVRFLDYAEGSGALEFDAQWRQATSTVCFQSNKEKFLKEFLKPFKAIEPKN